MRTSAIPLFASSLLVAVVFAACGGEAIIDAADGAGGSGASTPTGTGTTTGTGTGTTTTTTGPCECVHDEDCSQLEDACFYFACDGCSCVQTPEPPGVLCMTGVCDGNENCVECLGEGDCFGGESCVDNYCIPPIDVVCNQVCGQLDVCIGPTPECWQGCAQDLSDCNGQQVDQVLSCTAQLGSNCDIDAWINCMMSVACVEI